MSVFGKRESRGEGIYLSVIQGSFRQKVDEFTEGAMSRENKQGNTVYELHHETVNGHIGNVYLKKNERYGNELAIAVFNKEANMRVYITVPISSSYTRKFLMIAGNIDYRAPVEIVPHYFKDKKKPGKFVTGWCFFQHGSQDQIAEYINREDVPEIIKVEGLDGVKYNDIDALNYLWKKWMTISEKNKFGEPSQRQRDNDEEDTSHHSDDEEDAPPPRKPQSTEKKVEAPDF